MLFFPQVSLGLIFSRKDNNIWMYILFERFFLFLSGKHSCLTCYTVYYVCVYIYFFTFPSIYLSQSHAKILQLDYCLMGEAFSCYFLFRFQDKNNNLRLIAIPRAVLDGILSGKRGSNYRYIYTANALIKYLAIRKYRICMNSAI